MMDYKALTLLKFALLILLIVSLTACADQKLSLTSIYASNSCGITEQQIEQLNSASELAAFFSALPRGFSEKAVAPPDIDFEKEVVFLYALGERPNNGYGIEQYEDFALVKEGALHLPIRIQQPDADRLYPQMVTTPCELFTLSKTPFSSVTAK